jgi:hypothetical protein
MTFYVAGAYGPNQQKSGYGTADECFGDPDGHLSIVGVPDLILRVSDQLRDRRETRTDRVGALGLEPTPERVSDR